MQYTKDQRVFMVKQYFGNNESLAATVRKFRTKYGRNIELTSSTVRRVIEKFNETGSVLDAKRTGRPVTTNSNDKIEAVRESVDESPDISIRRRAQELQISRSSLQRILTKLKRVHDDDGDVGDDDDDVGDDDDDVGDDDDDVGDDDDDVGDDDDDDVGDNGIVEDVGGSSGSKQKKLAGKRGVIVKLPKKVGRPQKLIGTDDMDKESDDDDKPPQESKPLGHPPTDPTRNIVGTGRGKGRLKKQVIAKASTGRTRGRPANAAKIPDPLNSQDDEDSHSDEDEQTLTHVANGKKLNNNADNSAVFNGTEEDNEDDNDQQQDDDDDSVADLPAA